MAHIIIHVEDGLVQAVYSDSDVSVDVYDLDVSEFPDNGEEITANQRREEMESIVNGEGWGCVW